VVEGMVINELASESGQIVVYSTNVSVVTRPKVAGQSVMVDAHEVIVYTVVV
jgi:hypothetical protein